MTPGIGRRRFIEIATVGVIGGGSFVTLLGRIDRRNPVFGADRSFVTMNDQRVGPRTSSSDEAQLIAGWLNNGGYDDLTD